jgi:hypothetical protein
MMRTPQVHRGEDRFDPRHGHDGMPIEEEEYA